MSLLWFRRSRRSDPKEPEQESVETAFPARQERAPLKIRNVLLLNLQPSEGLAQIETAPPLGTRAGVMTTIRAAVPGIQFSDGRGELTGDDHHLTIDLGAGDPVATAVVAAEGDSAIEMLRELMQQSRWRIYAPRAGVFIEPQALDLFALDIAHP